MACESIQKNACPALLSATGVGISAAIAYGAAAIFTSINPVAGAVMAASDGIVTRVMNIILDKMGIDESCLPARVAAKAFTVFGSTLAGAAIATAIGFPITFTAALILAGITSVITVAAITAIFFICVSCNTGDGPVRLLDTLTGLQIEPSLELLDAVRKVVLSVCYRESVVED